jgi:hypothetical protein
MSVFNAPIKQSVDGDVNLSGIRESLNVDSSYHDSFKIVMTARFTERSCVKGLLSIHLETKEGKKAAKTIVRSAFADHIIAKNSHPLEDSKATIDSSNGTSEYDSL